MSARLYRFSWLAFAAVLGVLLGAAAGPASGSAAARPHAAAGITTRMVRPQADVAAGVSKAYVGLFGDNAVAIFNTVTNQVIGSIAVPTGPHGLVATPDGQKVYVSSDGDSKVSVIDTASDRISKTIEVPRGRTRSIAAGPGSNWQS